MGPGSDGTSGPTRARLRVMIDCRTLAVGAVARINLDGLLRNFISSSAADAAAYQW